MKKINFHCCSYPFIWVLHGIHIHLHQQKKMQHTMNGNSAVNDLFHPTQEEQGWSWTKIFWFLNTCSILSLIPDVWIARHTTPVSRMLWWGNKVLQHRPVWDFQHVAVTGLIWGLPTHFFSSKAICKSFNHFCKPFLIPTLTASH